MSDLLERVISNAVPNDQGGLWFRCSLHGTAQSDDIFPPVARPSRGNLVRGCEECETIKWLFHTTIARTCKMHTPAEKLVQSLSNAAQDLNKKGVWDAQLYRRPVIHITDDDGNTTTYNARRKRGK